MNKENRPGRPLSINPYSVRVTVRVTPTQAVALKALGSAVWLRHQIDSANKKAA